MRWRSPLAGGLAGAIVGSGIVVGLAVAGVPAGEPDAGRPAEDAPVQLAPVAEADARAFLAAWRDGLRATYVGSGVFRRVGPDGERFESELYIAQRPPQRLSIGRGGVSGRDGDRRLACGVDDSGELRCREAGAALSYDAEVRRDLRRLDEMVLDGPGRLALYRTEALGHGCFRLRLRFRYPAPPYGTDAHFCFDAQTGALAVAHLRREGGTVDRTALERISPTVTDAHFRRPSEIEPPVVAVPGGSAGQAAG